MIRLLPFILVPLLILGGLWYFRYNVSKTNLTASPIQKEEPIEVPKTLPQASPEVKILPSPTSRPISTPDPKLNTLEAQVTELKARVSALEKATPAPASANSSQSTLYIPLGSGGGPWGNTDWYSTSEYEISLDPGSYPNYKGMVLEVTFRLVEAAGTGYVRLYNSSDSSVTSSELTTTSTSFTLQTSSSFKLASGSKTYKLQVKSSQNKDLFIQSARIKVSF